MDVFDNLTAINDNTAQPVRLIPISRDRSSDIALFKEKRKHLRAIYALLVCHGDELFMDNDVGKMFIVLEDRSSFLLNPKDLD